MLNAMTVDVEEHFQVSAFDAAVSREDWGSMPSRVRVNTERVLDLLDEAGVRATFFVLGWVAERKPDLVRAIAGRGHEIASHGYSHRRVYQQRPDEFRNEAVRSRKFLQDVSGQPVTGYRAASFSIGSGNLWALDILADAGFSYDSSLFPVVHDLYGIPGAPRRIHRLRTAAGRELIEVPPSTVRLGFATAAVAGGGYLRILPAVVTRWAIRRLNRGERMPAVVYVHPWELDPDQPRIPAPLKSRLRHYSRIRTTEGKLRDLLRRFRFATLSEVIAREGASALPVHRVAAT